jgi:hypothetical protein
VVDASSIEVSRRRRRAKSDRIDGDKLLELLMRYYDGQSKVWAVLREPTPEQEDARRVSRELKRLTREQAQHTTRIASLLVLHGSRVACATVCRDGALPLSEVRSRASRARSTGCPPSAARIEGCSSLSSTHHQTSACTSPAANSPRHLTRPP